MSSSPPLPQGEHGGASLPGVTRPPPPAWAPCSVRRRFGDCVMVVLTADHVIGPAEEFERSVGLGCSRRRRGRAWPCTRSASPPAYAATGYGYLESRRGAVRRRRGAATISADSVPREARRGAGVGVRRPWRGTSGTAACSPGGPTPCLRSSSVHLPGHLAALAEAVSRDRSPQWEAALSTAFATLASGVGRCAASLRRADRRAHGAGDLQLERSGGLDRPGGLPAGRSVGQPPSRPYRGLGDARGNVVFTEDAKDS